MSKEFIFDVFLSHSPQDKTIVRKIAERLRRDGQKVWFDEWVIKPRESISAKIEEGLENSRVLVLCTSANAFGADWAQLEVGTFRFRDPLNQERHFILLRLDDTPIKGSLAQFSYINWHPASREKDYAKLLEACRLAGTYQEFTGKRSAEKEIPIVHKKSNILTITTNKNPGTDSKENLPIHIELIRTFRASAWIGRIAWSPDGQILASPSGDGKTYLWHYESGKCLHVLRGHERNVNIAVFDSSGNRLATGSIDQTVRIWDIKTGKCLQTLEAAHWIDGIFFGQEHDCLVTADGRGIVRRWDLASGDCFDLLYAQQRIGNCITSHPTDNTFVSVKENGLVSLFDVESGKLQQSFLGHEGRVFSVSFDLRSGMLVTAGEDRTVRLWNGETGQALLVFEGHTDEVNCVAFCGNNSLVASKSKDHSIRLWRTDDGACVTIIHEPSTSPYYWPPGLAFHPYRPILAVVGSEPDTPVDECDRRIHIYELNLCTRFGQAVTPTIKYSNAKVLLVGESGVGKTGLSKRLASAVWEPSDSTVGAWVTQWKLPVVSGQGVEREIWLWDFSGQADQRLIHQLYMDETALAVLVFDGQKEDLFETLSEWDHDLTSASRKEFAKLLVAGRVDVGGLRVDRREVEKFAAEHKFQGFLETSAKKNLGCEELKQAILANINWDEIPCRATEVLFKRLKEEIVLLKDEGRVLMRFNELRETLQLRWSGELNRFTDEELHAVLTLLAGPGVLWELAFGSWVLLQPERINAYAQAVIRTLQEDEHQRGCLIEERVLKGNLVYESSMPRLDGDEERFVLLAMHQTLVERGLCIRQPTSKGNLLVFPSYYRRERPDIIQHPAVIVNYRFTGFLDEIYATLVVRLHNTEPFQQDQLWRYAADFKTNTGKQLGVKLTRRAPGVGELEVYFDPTVAIEEKIIFIKYVHEHLLQYARDVERLRHYVCQQCGTPVGNREVAMKRLNDWLQGQPLQSKEGSGFKFRKGKEKLPTIICVWCEQRVPLWDEMEQYFANPEIQQRVRNLQEESAIVLSNQSKERALVGEVISTVALADQISRELNVSDQGIDMEIEFTNDAQEATGAKLYMQLKSGDSYLRKRKGDGTEIFTIKDDRHAHYWMSQAFPVLLVIRNAEGEVRWMEVRDWLKRATDNGKKRVKQIVFDGERLDVMSVRRWREKVLKDQLCSPNT